MNLAPTTAKANQVQLVRSPSALLQRKSSCGGSSGTADQCDHCRHNALGIQRKTTAQGSDFIAPQIVHDVLRSPSRPLDQSTREAFEHHFGHDLARVRIHDDSRAAESARAVAAQAYTVGNDIVFGGGRYAPETQSGRGLLAHELTHVVQQRFARTDGPIAIGPSNDVLEREAEMNASIVGMQNRSPSEVIGGRTHVGGKIGRSPKGGGIAAHAAVQRLDDLSASPGTALPVSTAAATPPGKTVKFWINAFIPSTYSGGFTAPAGAHKGHQVFKAPPLPGHWNSCFETDERGFSNSLTAASRLQVVAEFDTATRSLTGSTVVNPGNTFEIDCDSGVEKCNTPVVPKGRNPSLSSPWFGNRYDILIDSYASDPCVLVALDLAMRGDIAIDPVASTYKVNIFTTLFPAFEMYMSVSGGSPTAIFTMAPLANSVLLLGIPGLRPHISTGAF